MSLLEPIGLQIWLGSLALLVALIVGARLIGKLRKLKYWLTAVGCLLLTPLIYLGHPFIFAPLWIYADSLAGAAMALLAIAVAFAITASMVWSLSRKSVP